MDTLYRNYIKRILDIALSLCALIILSPLLVVVAVSVRIKLGSPVIFTQARPGKGERIFFLYKFRSMSNERDKDGKLLPDNERLTKFGKMLRSSSLDELPELFNIIKGDMSIVGPRPLSIHYLPHYPKKYRERHAVRPGLTGLAQISGRNNLEWNDRFEYDIQYVNDVSLKEDFSIIIKTVSKVFKHEDVAVRGTTKVSDYGPYQILQEQGQKKLMQEGMTYSEIGSYFWLEDKECCPNAASQGWLPKTQDSCFTFSGRSAIALAVKDILHDKQVKRAVVPSYCCVSMLQAFIDSHIELVFYDVSYKDGHFTYNVPEVTCDSVVLIMSYFGIDRERVNKTINDIHKSGAIVIEDITHSLLNRNSHSIESDYLIASLRKWMAMPAGGWLANQHGSLRYKPSIDANHAVQNKISAMQEKFQYISGGIESKETFLLENAKFDNELIHADSLLRIDDISLGIIDSVNVEHIKERRRNNAAYLTQELSKLKNSPLTVLQADDSEDVPLFVPVLLDAKRRDSLRHYLVSHSIYCPVHWPEVLGADISIRENELSIVCDQRYSICDMKAICDCIAKWCETQ